MEDGSTSPATHFASLLRLIPEGCIQELADTSSTGWLSCIRSSGDCGVKRFTIERRSAQLGASRWVANAETTVAIFGPAGAGRSMAAGLQHGAARDAYQHR